MVLNIKRRRDLRRCLHRVVLLDGKLVRRCIYADGRRGVIREYVTTKQGRVASGDDGKPKVRERRGRVTWRLAP
jgi:hypothetical protein